MLSTLAKTAPGAQICSNIAESRWNDTLPRVLKPRMPLARNLNVAANCFQGMTSSLTGIKTRARLRCRTSRRDAARAASKRTDGEASMGQPRNLLVAVDNSEDADYSVSWTIAHLYRPGDKLHLLHCIPRFQSDRNFLADASHNGQGTLVDTILDGPREELVCRHWETRHALRSRFEAAVLQKGVAEADIVYDVLEEALPNHLATKASSLFSLADVEIGAAAAVPSSPPANPVVDNGGDKPPTTELLRREVGDVDGSFAVSDSPSGELMEFETEGMAGDAIVARARELNAAAVVLASRSKGPVAEFFLGSITNFCTHHCTRPVVVLHKPGGDSQQSSKGLLLPPAAREIAVAVDCSPHSEKALIWTLKHMYRPGDSIRLIHIVPQVGTQVAFADGFGHGIGMNVVLSPKEAARRAARGRISDGVSEKYEAALKNAGVPFKMELLPGRNNESVESLGAAIIKKAKDISASSLVLASHNRGPIEEFFVGSVANYVTHHCTEVPIVVLHP